MTQNTSQPQCKEKKGLCLCLSVWCFSYKEVDHFFEEKYQKKKKIHQSAMDEWKTNLGSMTELDAMYQYMKLARGLAT
jgi:hypothetical protein